MTNPFRGSSLLQARDVHPHTHSPHRHHHRHRHLHAQKRSAHEPHHDSDLNSEHGGESIRHRPRAPPAVDRAIIIKDTKPAPLITQIIQTVSLIQFVDSAGSPIETQTQYAAPNTILVDSLSGKTVAISNPDSSTAIAVPGSDRGPGPGSSLSSSTNGPAQITGIVSSPPSIVSSAPSSQYPTLSDAHNGTNRAINGTYTSAAANFTLKATVSSAPTSLSFTTTEIVSTSSYLSTSVLESTFSTNPYIPTSTNFAGQAGFGDVGGDAQPTSQASPSPDQGSLSPQQKQVIGGVVGGVAGMAFFTLLILLLLKHKRRKDVRLRLEDSQSESTTSRGFDQRGSHGNASDSAGIGGRAMSERLGHASIMTAWASLAQKKGPPANDSPEGAERGFYRVSGRKLPSVLHTGGDGYTDPRGSVASGTSDYYRGSQAFEPSGSSMRLALGTPMRPVSGVPIIRSGPARVPITEHNPFADPPSTPPGDGPIPSLKSRDSPRGSSRFQESL